MNKVSVKRTLFLNQPSKKSSINKQDIIDVENLEKLTFSFLLLNVI
jgi:hypothetical protein